MNQTFKPKSAPIRLQLIHTEEDRDEGGGLQQPVQHPVVHGLYLVLQLPRYIDVSLTSELTQNGSETFCRISIFDLVASENVRIKIW